MASPWQYIDQTALDEDKTRQELEDWKDAQRRKLADDWVVKQKELVRNQFEQLAQIRASQVAQPTVEADIEQPIVKPSPSAFDRAAEYRRTMPAPKLFNVPLQPPSQPSEPGEEDIRDKLNTPIKPSLAETLLNAARPFGEKVQESGEWADRKFRESLLKLGDELPTSPRFGWRNRQTPEQYQQDLEKEAGRGFTPMIPEGTPRALAGLLGDVLNKGVTGNRTEGIDPVTMIHLKKENPELFEKILKEQRTQGSADWERWKTEETNPAVEIVGSLTNPLGILGGSEVAQIARAGAGVPKILKASEIAKEAAKNAPKVIEGASRVLGDVPVGMGTEDVSKIKPSIGLSVEDVGWKRPNVPALNDDGSITIRNPNDPKLTEFKASKDKLAELPGVEVKTQQGWIPASQADRGTIVYQGAHRAGETPIVSTGGAQGPGTYAHAVPDEASGYAQSRAEAKTNPSSKLTAQEAIDAVKKLREIVPDAEIKPWELKDKTRLDAEELVAQELWDKVPDKANYTPTGYPANRQIYQWMDQIFPTRIVQGQNIRPMYLSEDMRFLNTDDAFSPREIEELYKQMGGDVLDDDTFKTLGSPDGEGVLKAARWLARDKLEDKYSGRAIQTLGGHVLYAIDAEAQRLLSKIGYDGIKFRNNNYLIFQDSLPKVRNAITGEQGGFATPDLTGQIAGGAIGAAASYDPNASPEENAMRIAGGALVGTAVGGLGSKSLGLSTKPTRTNAELSSLFEALSGSETDKFKSTAFKKAADTIKSMGNQEISKLLEGKIPGIGKGIQTRIKEYIDTGTIQGSSGGASNITPSGGPKGASYTGPTRKAGHEQLWNRVRNVISHQGVSGKQLAEMLHESREVSETFAGKLNSMMPIVRSLNRKEFDHFIDVAEGKVKPGNDRIAQAFAEWDKVRDMIYQRAKAAKMDIGFEPNYFPHVYDPKTFKGSEWNKAIDRLVKTKAASNRIKAAELLRYMTGTIRNRRQPNLEMERLADLPGYRRTKDVLLTYIQEATDAIAEREIFGKSDVKALKLIDGIRKEGYDDSAAMHLFNVAVGAEQYGKSRESASRVIRAFMVFTKLGFGALSNMQQPLNVASVYGVSKILKNIPLALSKEGQEFAIKAGVTLDATIMNLREGAGYEGTWGRIGAPFFNEVEMFNRQLTAVVGREVANELFIKARAGSQAAIKELNKARIDTKNIQNMNALSEDDVIRYARNLVERTQFKVDPQDLPVWSQTPSGKLITQFRTFGYNQTAFMAREVIAPLKEGNVMPLVRFALLGIPIGFLSVEARNILSVRPSEEDMNKRLIDYFIQAGGLGLAGDIIRGVIPWRGTEYRDSARTTLHTIGTIAGPAGSTAIEGAQAIYDAVQGRPTNLERFGIKQIPVIGRPVQNILLPYDDPTLTPLQKRRLERQRGSSTSLQERRLKRIQERR